MKGRSQRDILPRIRKEEGRGKGKNEYDSILDLN
jgi:hypothetical protein